jgi:hypothetical protein
VDTRITAHEAKADPHSQYATKTVLDGWVGALTELALASGPDAVSDHVAAADPHSQYLKESEAPTPSDTNPVLVNLSGVQNPGTSLDYARADHRHVAYTSTPAALGAAAAMGSSNNMSRADHVHPFPTAADVGAVSNLKGSSGLWSGTQAEYEAIPVKDQAVLYVIV